MLTQWFERARFEYHPSKPPEFKVLLGLLGDEMAQPSQATPHPAEHFDPSSVVLELNRVASGFEQPVHATHAGDGSGRLFVVERAGRIRGLDGGTPRARPFLDITDLVGSGYVEQGLLSVAFHPNYRANGLFFVDYTDKAGNTVVARYRVGADPNVADRSSATTILTIDQPYQNHNGGQLAFGHDGYLYIGMGDGGSAGDPHHNGQSLATLLGKLLRIDVNGGSPYAIPPDNPFRGTAGARPEIWALGLRNPWRFSFDRETGDLFIGDVGQDAREEVDLEPAGSRGGRNYGWNTMEGSSCFRPASGCNRTGLELPIAEYGHDRGCSITGGFRYRGADVPALRGGYFFADFCSGRIWGMASDAGRWTKTELLNSGLSITSFAEDERGELYVMELSNGTLYRLGAHHR